jgi:hypothetical protein
MTEYHVFIVKLNFIKQESISEAKNHSEINFRHLNNYLFFY